MPATHLHDLKKTYAKIAQGYEHSHQGDIDAKELEEFLTHMPKHSKVLDLGAGNGRDSRWFADHEVDVTMLDMSPEMLEIAAKKVPEATVVQGDMTEMSFENESFDGVWARASLLHLTKEEGAKVVKKVFEILKNGGMFFCLLKEGAGEKEVVDAKYGQEAKRFFSFYTKEEAEKLLQQIGFINIESATKVGKSGISWVQITGLKK